MRILLVAVAGPLFLIGGIAHAQRQPSEDEMACKLARDCGPAKAMQISTPAGDNSLVIEGQDDRPFCFGGSGCGHASKPAATQSFVASSRPGTNSGAKRVVRGIGREPSRGFVQTTTSDSASGAGSMDMALIFPNGSADLSSQARGRLAAFASGLTKRASLAALSFRINGHTNSVGTRESNLDLSRRRAQSVVDYMVSLGVSKDRLEARGVGFDDPIPGSKPTDPANRRVEIVVK